MLTFACCHERHFVSSVVNGSIDYTPITINCGVRVIVTSGVLPCASINKQTHVVDRGLTEIYYIRAERGKMPSVSKKDDNNVAIK